MLGRHVVTDDVEQPVHGALDHLDHLPPRVTEREGIHPTVAIRRRSINETAPLEHRHPATDRGMGAQQILRKQGSGGRSDGQPPQQVNVHDRQVHYPSSPVSPFAIPVPSASIPHQGASCAPAAIPCLEPAHCPPRCAAAFVVGCGIGQDDPCHHLAELPFEEHVRIAQQDEQIPRILDIGPLRPHGPFAPLSAHDGEPQPRSVTGR